MVRQVIKYHAEDGEVFDSPEEAREHEFQMSAKHLARYSDYIDHSYSGRALLEKHKLSDYGTWEIRGEDSNADLGGSHHEPSLGFFEGTLEQVIRKAVSMQRFYTWGGGGSIRYCESPLATQL